MRAATCVVSTVPAAAQDAGVLAPVRAASRWSSRCVYDPWPTPLAAAAAARPAQVLVGGLDLLVHQAVLAGSR